LFYESIKGSATIETYTCTNSLYCETPKKVGDRLWMHRYQDYGVEEWGGREMGIFIVIYVELLRGISERGGEGGLEIEYEGRRKMKGNVCKKIPS
jgi:hypothetical protein